MVWSVHWDHGFVVGGDAARRLTPSFRLREFMRPDGSVRVHRELVTAVQLLRDRFAQPLHVAAIDADGLAATLTGSPTPPLQAAADTLRARGVLDRTEARPDGVHVGVADPASLPPIDLEQALETAFLVTAAFETSGDKFQQVTGNFDGAGISFGPAQVNFASGTLVPLFRRFRTADEPALRACFGDADDYAEWLEVMASPAAAQLAWATSISTGRGRHDVAEPWKSALQAAGRVPRFRELMVDSILRDYGAKMLRAIAALERLRPGIRIDHLRCICSLYDLVVQQGSLDKAWSAIEARVAREEPQEQFALTRIAVEERGRKAAAEWQADAISRRVGILRGVPETVAGRQRANINFYMLRDVRIGGEGTLMPGDISVQLARVSEAVASGRTLLA